MITVDQMVAREVIYCVSTLVNDIADTTAGPLEADLNDCDLFYRSNWVRTAEEAGLTIPEHDPDEDPQDVARDVCEIEGILDPTQEEALEHWIVSDWLYKQLQARGELVGEIAGIPIWGRTCSGQAIAMDSVIIDIWRDMTGEST